jgi:class 3 adenylate cyclase
LTDKRVERRLAAVMAADVAGYSRLMGADEEGTLGNLKALRKAVVDPKIVEHRGRIVKTTGDGMLVEFASAVDAATTASARHPASPGCRACHSWLDGYGRTRCRDQSAASECRRSERLASRNSGTLRTHYESYVLHALCLACGRIATDADRVGLQKHFTEPLASVMV